MQGRCVHSLAGPVALGVEALGERGALGACRDGPWREARERAGRGLRTLSLAWRLSRITDPSPKTVPGEQRAEEEGCGRSYQFNWEAGLSNLLEGRQLSHP